MRFVDEFRDPAAARALVKSITELATGDEFKFMEVCGGHTHTICRRRSSWYMGQAVRFALSRWAGWTTRCGWLSSPASSSRRSAT
jgi:hydrogenase maturation factor